MRPYFFLSYARVDGQDAYVQRFYDDLCEALVELADPDRETPTGFLDNAALRLGDEWPRHLEQALSSCRTMVALYSPDYFRSKWCSREAAMVMARARLYRQRTRLSSSALIPVLWDPVPVPDEVAHIQYLSAGLGPRYRADGLRRILQQDPTGPDYRGAVALVAERVAEAALRGELPEVEPAPLRTYPLSFQPRTEPLVPGASVAFYVAAGTTSTVPEPRRATPYYGAVPLAWNPYRPQEDYPLYQQAQRTVTNMGYGTAYHEVGSGLAGKLGRAWDDDQVTILLVDPWSAPQQPYRRQLELFDRTDHPATGVLVPCHPASEQDLDELWLGVTGLFQRKSCRGPHNDQFKLRVPYKDFRKSLERMVTAAQSSLIRRRTIARPPDPGGAAPVPGRPFLRGPGTDPDQPTAEPKDGGPDDAQHE
ncbi:TIR-like protein FxsC [Streptacidiphilus sp. PAMC 29251]